MSVLLSLIAGNAGLKHNYKHALGNINGHHGLHCRNAFHIGAMTGYKSISLTWRTYLQGAWYCRLGRSTCSPKWNSCVGTATKKRKQSPTFVNGILALAFFFFWFSQNPKEYEKYCTITDRWKILKFYTITRLKGRYIFVTNFYPKHLPFKYIQLVPLKMRGTNRRKT